MRVDVCPLVFWVNVFVQASAVINECVLKVKLNLILACSFQNLIIDKSNSMIFELQISFADTLPIYLDIRDLSTLEVKEEVPCLR